MAQEAGLRLEAVMLLVENVPQSVGLVADGEASAQVSWIRQDTLRRVERRGKTGGWSCPPEPAF